MNKIVKCETCCATDIKRKQCFVVTAGPAPPDSVAVKDIGVGDVFNIFQ